MSNTPFYRRSSTLVPVNFNTRNSKLLSQRTVNNLQRLPSTSQDDKPFVAILKYLINQSHPANVLQVLPACRALLAESGASLFGDVWSSIMSDYNEDKCVAVELLGGTEIGIICPEGRINNSLYFHPRIGRIFSVDQELQQSGIADEESQSLNSAANIRGQHSPYRLALERAVEIYAKRFYPVRLASEVVVATPITGVATAIYGNEEMNGLLEFSIIIRSFDFNTKNNWAGLWLSRWKFSVRPGQTGTYTIQGEIKVDLQYSEDGNCRLRQSKQFTREISLTFPRDGPRAFASLVVDAIQECEISLRTSLERIYTFIDSCMLRAMRRVVPIGNKLPTFGSLSNVIQTEVYQRAFQAGNEARARACDIKISPGDASSEKVSPLDIGVAEKQS